MRSRAQQSRDAALRRLAHVNRSLAAAALVCTGVITDVVANTASGHARTVTTTERRPAATPHRANVHHHVTKVHHHAAESDDLQSSSAPSVPSTSSAPATGSVPAPSPAPVVAVSGGS